MLPGEKIKAALFRFNPDKDAYRSIKDEAVLERVMYDNEFHMHESTTPSTITAGRRYDVRGAAAAVVSVVGDAKTLPEI
jgi:hypothetical protein